MVSPSARRVHYQDVPVVEDHDEFAASHNDDEELPSILRRRHRAPPNHNNACLKPYLVLVMAIMILTSIALVGWKKEFHSSHKQQVKTPAIDMEGLTKSDNDNNDKKESNVVHYDPSAALHSFHPFDLSTDYTTLSQPPPIENDNNQDSLGYMMQPNVVNNTLVFVSEGDLYLTKLLSQQVAAVKLTTTVGNVRTPLMNPVYPHLIAYSGTYTGRREVYLLNLSQRTTAAQRLTYWDSPGGIYDLVAWKDDGLSLVFSAMSNEVGLPDVRLYQLTLDQDGNASSTDDKKNTGSTDGNKKKHDKDSTRGHGRQLTHGPLRVWQIQPIPLTQAIDGAYDDGCYYFTRFSQSSNTIRYVGGTAESLWAYCRSETKAVPLTADYRGTSKAPRIVEIADEKKYLLFMSDRIGGDANSKAGTMNLWAMPLLKQEQLYSSNKNNKTKTLVQLTQVSCDYNGKSLVEYAVDSVTGNVILRIGADLHLLESQDVLDKLSSGDGKLSTPRRLEISVYSDFHEHQERLIPVSLPEDVTTVDVYETAFGTTAALLGLRGQLFVTPIVEDTENVHPYSGAGMNLPPRRYRVAPGTMAGGAVRILATRHVPLYLDKTARRLALALATDPKSATGEHAFYLLETQSDASQSFVDVQALPRPFLGGHVDGGSVADGGLGSVNPDSLQVSPCGRRVAWTDRDGRICVMTLPLYQNGTSYKVLPQQNEQGEPMVGTDEVDLSWSPGGRYLAISHSARNQFSVISVADCGDPETNVVKVGRVVQATPDRFNSVDAYWGKTALDYKLKAQSEVLSKLMKQPVDWPDGATVLYFLSDRDIVTDVQSPWGTRGPSPHFPKHLSVFALPLVSDNEERGPLTTTKGPFGGGGAGELWVDNILALEQFLDAADEQAETPTRRLDEAAESSEKEKAAPSDVAGTMAKASTSDKPKPSEFPKDREIEFGPSHDLSFARKAYRIGNIPPGEYSTILCQPIDDPSLALLEKVDGKTAIKIFSVGDFPSDSIEPMPVDLPDHELTAYSTTTTREYIVLFFGPGDTMKVVPNSAAGLVSLIKDQKMTQQIADTGQLALSVWPALEYQQMYNDAWRMLRDYFYDPGMNGVDWPEIHSRYQSLVKRCAKREELDDVLKQMASELSALHVFVYGGEYKSPLHGSKILDFVYETASLGATLMRSAEWKGYVVTSIPERDPDFNLVDGTPSYSPLSNRSLHLTGQRGLEVGDVIVGVNGESVMRVPDIHMLLRGMAGRSVRLEVLRLASGVGSDEEKRRLKKDTASDIAVVPEPLITVPITPDQSADLRYGAWEWQTRETAKQLAQDAGFSVGYVHLRSMSGPQDADAFFRGFYPDYDKQALIIDVRHNRGGNIDSWLLDVLQRKAWMYWHGRTTNITTGGLGWDEQFAFRGHLVVLIDEHTASDGEGFSRGVSELGLGKLIGTRTWGGGIWLSSDNRLVDGGIATAPEVGTYNDKFGWGLGIEQMGVEPDFEVDNDPRIFYDGKDQQLEYAIDFLAKWLKQEPIVLPKSPGPKRDMSLPDEAKDCPAT